MTKLRRPAAETPVDLDRMPTLGDIARYHAHVRPDAIALSYEGRVTPYGAFDRHSTQVANALTAAGVQTGDRIAYLGKNCDRYFEILFGAAKVGVVVTPVGWRLAPAEAAFILKDCRASIVFVGPDGGPQAEAALALLEHAPLVIAIDGALPATAIPYEFWRRIVYVFDHGFRVTPAHVALQLYTSGTTGQPKGVMLTHANLLVKQKDGVQARMAWHDWTPDDVSLVAMPVAHIGGTLWGVLGLLHGARGVVAREFEPLQVLDFIERDRVSKMFMVPAALQIVVREPRARRVDYSCLNYILYGASPIPLDLLRECLEVFGCGFCQQYGMTETSGTIVYLPPEDHDPAGNARMRSTGLPMPGVELKVVDERGARVPPNVVGEVVTRSAGNMAGYWNMDEATRQTVDAEGWLRTGDAGYLDEDGYLFIHDRVKDMIISGGENIYPAEVEGAIYGHPRVAEVAVIGVPDEKWGEAAKAIVVLTPGVDPDPDDILAFARSRIAAFKVPKSVDFVPDLPRNASGKVLRRELREPFWVGRARRVN